ncbi:MAG TPA: rhodanese-like domain-containing protein [Thermoanaerobaculia bacterium]|nr:rhodanese-like domain-containing protein [Thermoanaerobaculia bacterium]
MLKNSFARGVVLIAAALVLAIVTNGFASRTRRLMLPGFYPNALKVPPKQPERVVPPVAPSPATATVAPVVVPATTATPSPTTTPSGATGSQPVELPAEPRRAESPSLQMVPKPATDVSRFKPHPSQAYVEINGDDVAALHASGALFLDARRTSVFEQGHIAGARSFSVWESDIDDKVNALYSERPNPEDQDQPIVIYCSGGACEDSHMLAQKLWGIQFNNVYVYKDGFPDWQKRGGAVRTGGQP